MIRRGLKTARGRAWRQGYDQGLADAPAPSAGWSAELDTDWSAILAADTDVKTPGTVTDDNGLVWTTTGTFSSLIVRETGQVQGLRGVVDTTAGGNEHTRLMTPLDGLVPSGSFERERCWLRMWVYLAEWSMFLQQFKIRWEDASGSTFGAGRFREAIGGTQKRLDAQGANNYNGGDEGLDKNVLVVDFAPHAFRVTCGVYDGVGDAWPAYAGLEPANRRDGWFTHANYEPASSAGLNAAFTKIGLNFANVNTIGIAWTVARTRFQVFEAPA